MARTWCVDADLTVTHNDQVIQIQGRSEELRVTLPTVSCGLSLPQMGMAGGNRMKTLRQVDVMLKRMGLGMVVLVGDQHIAQLGVQAQGNFWSRMLGLGAVTIWPWRMVRAGFSAGS